MPSHSVCGALETEELGICKDRGRCVHVPHHLDWHECECGVSKFSFLQVVPFE